LRVTALLTASGEEIATAKRARNPVRVVDLWQGLVSGVAILTHRNHNVAKYAISPIYQSDQPLCVVMKSV